MGEPCDNQLQVRLSDITANFHYFQRRKRTAAVVKADAYGIGMAEVATALHMSGCEEFYVFTLAEACRLRDILGAGASIYFFSGLVNKGDGEAAARHGVIPVLNRLQEISAWHEVAWQGDKKPLCVHVDSGMNRLGLPLSQWQDFCDFYNSHKQHFSTPLVVSHLACADDPAHEKNPEQRNKMMALMKNLPHAELSLSATFGALLDKSYHGSQLRIGIGLYGVGSDKLKNPFTWQSRILQIRSLQAGETIGYGATPVSSPTRVAVIACGYADGLRRNFTGKVFINGKPHGLLGRVSMDCCAINIGDAAGIKEGDFATLIGAEQSLQELADSMATIPYEVLCGIGRRVVRKFVA